MPAPDQGAAIRAPVAGDVPALRGVVAATGLFPAELLDGMIAGFLRDGSDVSGAFWLVHDGGMGPGALAWCAPEEMTDGTWNMLLIAVRPDRQGRGIGAALMRHAEARLAAAGARLLLVETSGLPAFARTRAFYAGLGYGEEARIRDFYQAGEDKVVFRKALAGPAA